MHLRADKLAKQPVIPSALYNLRVALLACPLLIGCLAAGCQSGKGGSDLFTESRITYVNPSSVPTEEGEVIYCDSAEMTSRSSLFLYGTYATICLAVSGCGLLLWKRRKLRKEIHKKQQDKHALEDALVRKEEQCQTLFKSYLSETPILCEIRQLILRHKEAVVNEELLTARQWEQLFAAIDAGANNFTSRLSKAHPDLKEEDLRFCCLLKADLRYADMALLLGRTKNMMYKRRDLIVRRLNLPATTVNLNEYIEHF